MADLKQYLDLAGLTKYDGLIKDYIDDAGEALKNEINIGVYATKEELNAETTARQEADKTHTENIGKNTAAIAKLNGNATMEGSVAKAVADAKLELQGNIDKKVDKVDGKGLSTNDYTTEEKNKLAGIAADAQVNVIEKVSVNGTELTPDANKAVNVTVPTGALANKNQVAEADLETELANKLNGKADKATTLAGYGITDAYTKDEADVAAKVKVETAGAATEGYLKTYVITQNGTEIGKIDIPKELVVTSGQVVVNPAGQEEGKYIELTIANQDAPIYINVKDLVDVYTAIEDEYEENGLPINSVSVNISDDNVISAFVLENGIQTYHLRNKSVTGTKIATKSVVEQNIADSAIGTRSIIDKTVTLAKLEQNVQNTLNNSASTSYVNNAIQALDAEVTSTGSELVTVKVDEVDGKVTAVTVTENFESIPEASITALFA